MKQVSALSHLHSKKELCRENALLGGERKVRSPHQHIPQRFDPGERDQNRQKSIPFRTIVSDRIHTDRTQ